MSKFLSMGEYGPYVWSSYGLVAMVFGLYISKIIKRRQETLRVLKRWFAQE